MMGERTVAQEALFYEFSLERHVPADHLLRFLQCGFSPGRTSKLAVDRQVEKSAVTQPVLLVEKESNCPDLFWLERALCAKLSSRVPGWTLP